MALSLAVLLVPIALVLIFYRVVLSGDSPVAVDPAPALESARAAGAFPVAAPAGLGDDWHVTSATFRRADDGATLRLGYVDPDDDPVQLLQSSVPPATLLPAELTAEAEAKGTVRTAMGAWRVYDGRPGETALVLTGTGRTVIVVGSTDTENLTAMAESLS